MAKNRDYTGLVRTPSSMAWLIGERARIKGRIDRLQLLAERIPLELETLSQQLRSLDAVFPLHEVKVDPSVIRGKKKYAQKLLPHGAMTRGIYDCLRENSECGPVYSTEVMHFIARTNNLDIKAIGRERLLGQIAKRLGAMAKKGEILRCHDIYPGNQEEGRWCLPPDTD